MESKYYTGIDISAEFFTVSCLEVECKKITTFDNFENSAEGFRKFLKEINKISKDKSKFIIGMEATGVYGEKLAHFIYGNGYKLVIENPLKVKKSFGLSGKKSDAIDSRRIAEYLYRFNDELKFWQPKHENIEYIRVLLAQREQLNKQKVANINARKALQRKQYQIEESIQIYSDMISVLEIKIKDIERKAAELIKDDPELSQAISNITSIPGVGMIMSLYILVITNGFTENLDYKKIASYLGIVPLIYESGKSIRKRSSSSGIGPGELRKTLYLVSLSARNNNKIMKEYFLRKVAEGKSKRLVLNNIGNKLLKLIIAIVKSGKTYSENFRSINPVFLKN